MSHRIVINCWGSYGDVYPYIGLARALQAHGHEPVLATAELYREAVESERIEYAHPIVRLVLRWRTLRRLRDNWINSLRGYIASDGRTTRGNATMSLCTRILRSINRRAMAPLCLSQPEWVATASS